MSAELLYLLATGATWVGYFLLFRAIWLGFKLWFGNPGFDVEKVKKGLLTSAGVGAVLVVLAFGLPKPLGREGLEGVTVPIIWPYAPIGGWILMIGVFMVVARGIQAVTGITAEERVAKWKASGIWAVTALGGWWWLHASSGKIWFLRGQLPVHWPVVLALVVLAVVTMAVMIRLERATRTKGLGKTVVTHLTLVLGCVVFGIPFAWLLSTSFKEEIDIANTDGLVWIPKVQETYPFTDPERPLMEAWYEGRWVKASVDSELGDGKLLLEVERPYGLRGRRFEVAAAEATEVKRFGLVFETEDMGEDVKGFVFEDREDGARVLELIEPADRVGERIVRGMEDVEPVRNVGLRWENYTDALEWMPFETWYGVRYFVNTVWLVVMSVIGTVISCALVAYGFSRLRFPGRDQMFSIMLATMMLPGAVTMLPQFLIFRSLGWIDTLMPLWVPTFFAGAFNVFLLKQFFSTIPIELEEAARIDGCGYLKTFWTVMMPQVKPALAAISIWTFMAAWNNFMGPLIFISSPEKMPVAYALQLFSGDRGTEPGLMMAFATMTVFPVVLLFFFAQRYFIEGVQLSGLGGR